MHSEVCLLVYFPLRLHHLQKLKRSSQLETFLEMLLGVHCFLLLTVGVQKLSLVEFVSIFCIFCLFIELPYLSVLIIGDSDELPQELIEFKERTFDGVKVVGKSLEMGEGC
jgi:hypothetical protein